MPERLSPNPSPKAEIRRSGRITDMILPNGEVRIIYGDHEYPTDISLVQTNTDGLFLENVHTPKTRKGLNILFNGNDQYSVVKQFAQQNNIPLLFHDVDEKESVSKTRNFSESLNDWLIVAPVIVLGLTSVSIPESIALTSPLLYNSITQHALRIQPKENNPDLVAKVSRLAAKATPYKGPYVLRLRNALWAAKINWALEHGLGSHFTTVVGAAHVGLEDYLRREAEGKEAKILRATSKMWHFFAEPSSYYTIRRFSQSKKRGGYDRVRVFEVPKLKAIAQGLK